jgi:PAS domain S-box-containing protein
MIDANDTRFPTGQFWTLFVPVALVAIVVAFAFRQLRIDSQFEQISAAERSHLQQLSGFMAAEVSFSVHQLDALTREAVVQHAIDRSSPRANQALQAVFLTLANRHPTYQQIRWIDESGEERVRVMRSENAPFIVKPPQLRNEITNYYFKNAASQFDREIYISRLDFNAGNGQSKQPLQPTIRVAKPIQNSQRKRRGIIIIDIAIPYLLEALKIAHVATPDTDYIVVNEDGYGLAPNARANQVITNAGEYAKFSIQHPTAWKHISSSRVGSAELEDGIWVWEKVGPKSVIARMAAATSGGVFDITRIHSDELSLKLVAHKSNSTFAKSTENSTVPIIVGTILLLSIYAWSLWFMMRSQVREKHAAIEAAHATAQASHMRRLKELEERFHLSVEASSVGMLVVDAEGTIIQSNTAAESMLGYEKGALQGLTVDSLLPSAQRSGHARLRAEFLRRPEVRKMGQGRKLEAVTADGRKILVEVGLNPYLDHGKQVVLASIIDLSGKR